VCDVVGDAVSALLATVGFTAAGAAFALLAVLLLVHWRGKLEGGLLIAACVSTAVWASVLAVEPYVGGFDLPAVAGIELLRDGAWLLFLSTTLKRLRLPLLLLVGWSIWLLAVVLVASAAVSERARELLDLAEVWMMAGLLMSAVILVFLEQLYRNATTERERSNVRHFVVGLALLFVYELYVYAEALLLGGIEPLAWTGRGYVATAACPLIAVSARRHGGWAVQLYLSRSAAFYGAAVSAIGGYLALMAAAGYAVRFYGGKWGASVQLALLGGAGAVLVALVLSSRVRRDLKVFLNKHFYRSGHDYRREWLRFAEALSAPLDRSGLHAAVIEAVARIVGAPRGLLWVQESGREGYEAAHAWPGGELPNRRIASNEPSIAFIAKTKWIIDLDEYRLEPDVYDHIELPQAWVSDAELRLVVPLFLRDELLGFITLAGKGIRSKLNYEDHDLLKTIGSQIATYLRRDEIQSRLATAQQFEAYHRLSAFVLHDLKNIVAQQTLVLANAKRHKDNPAFMDDAMATIGHSVQRMNRMLSQLHSRDLREPRRASLRDVLRQAVQHCAHETPKADLRMDGEEIFVRCDPDRLASALEHLIRNAQQVTTANGRVTVTAARTNGRASISVEDDGVGMDREFIRNRLFNPFDTTKGSAGMGIGAYQAREYVAGLGGTLRVDSTPGAGTVVTIELPALADHAESQVSDAV
jgi:putative PEP-CTERM system histidine kinase